MRLREREMEAKAYRRQRAGRREEESRTPHVIVSSHRAAQGAIKVLEEERRSILRLLSV